MQPLISIVMPVYRVAEYLGKAVRSVMAQSEKDWELILVDDASPDSSGAICDALAGEDARISVIHLPENGGLSNARNVGMKTARGRFLMFLDSDDWVEETLLSELAAVVRSDNAPQMIVWGVTEEHFAAGGQLKETRRLHCPREYLVGEDAVRSAALRLERVTLLGYAWNKLYDAGLLRECNAEFEKVPLIEDILFNLSILGHVSRMQILDSTPYHYARRDAGSLTHGFLPYYFQYNTRRVETMLGLYEKWDMKDQAARVLAPIYARYALSALQRNCDPRAQMKHKDRRGFAKALFESELFNALASEMKKGSGVSGLPGRMLTMRNVCVCLLAGRAVYFVSTNMKTLFMKLSGSRQEERKHETADHRGAQL